MPRLLTADLFYHIDQFFWDDEFLELQMIELSSIESGDLESITQVDRCIERIIDMHEEDIIDETLAYQTISNLARALFLPLLVAGRPPGPTANFIRSRFTRIINQQKLISLLIEGIEKVGLRYSEISENLLTDISKGRQSIIRSGYLRHVFNVLFVYFLLSEDFHQTNSVLKQMLVEKLLICLEKSVSTDNAIPVRKVLLLLFQFVDLGDISKWLYVNENSASLLPLGPSESQSSSIQLLLARDSLSVPRLTCFGSFVTMVVHLNTLKESAITNSYNPGITEAIDVSKQYLREYIRRYGPLSGEELKFLKSLNIPLPWDVLTNHMSRPSESLHPNTPKTIFSPFSLHQLANSVISNYQLLETVGNSGISPADSSSSSLSLIHEAYESCSQWMMEDEASSGYSSAVSQETVIEAIAEAAVPPPEKPPSVKGGKRRSFCRNADNLILNHFLKNENHSSLVEFIVRLLKVLLTSSRVSSSAVRDSNEGPLFSPACKSTGTLKQDNIFSNDRNLLVKHLLDLGVEICSEDTIAGKQLRHHHQVICNAVCGLLISLARASAGDRTVYGTICSSITENSGILVLLKIITSASENGVDIVMDDINGSSTLPILSNLREKKSWRLATPSNRTLVLYRAMVLLYWVTRKSPVLIKKYLIHYKLGVILKRFFRAPNKDIQRIAYKLFKIQMKHLYKSWKSMHMKLISNCYNMTKTEVVDEWIVNDGTQTETTVGDSSTSKSVSVLVEEFLSKQNCGDKSMDSSKNSLSVEEYEKMLLSGSIDFCDQTQIEKLCLATGDDPATFFLGYDNFDEFILRELGA